MLAQLDAHTEGVSSLSVSCVRNLLVSTSGDKTAALWDLQTYTKLGCLSAHSDSVNNSLFANENCLVTCSDDRSVCVWDLRNLGQPSARICSFKDGVNKVITSCDGQLLISAVDDGLVHIHDFSGQEVDRFWVATNTVNDLILDPTNSSVLLTCSEDRAVRSWRLGVSSDANVEDRLIASFDEFENPVNHIGLRNGWLYAACSECVFSSECCDGQFGSSARVFSCHSDYIRGIDFYHEDMFTISDDTTVIQWGLTNCEPIRRLKVHDDFSMAMTIGCNAVGEDLLITGCESGQVRVWKLPFQTEAFRNE